jgi:predicted enzyme related to lactoylglutathione lyase
MKKSPVTHFEMGYEDPTRIQKFYQSAFGWETKEMGPEMGNYILATTTETDENQMIKTPGNINGGFYDLKQSPYKEPSVVLEVEDMAASMKAVEEAGGKIIGVPDQTGKVTMKPQDIPGVGLWMSFTDTEGNRLSMIQPTRNQEG